MKIKITGWNEDIQAFYCDYGEETRKFIDLFVDGTLDRRYKNPKSLIGKTVEVSYLHPFVQIAHDVKLLKERKK